MAHEAGNLNELRAHSGQRCSDKGLSGRNASVPVRRDHRRADLEYVPSDGNDAVLGSIASFRRRVRQAVQIMVKDSKKYAATGGWGFADFTDGKPADEALHKTCFPCHEPAKARDFVFTRYAP